MATFEVKIVKVDAIEEHPNADAIEFARIAGYVSIVKKGQVKAGDLVVYIPEAAVMPQWLLESIGLWKHDSDKGALAGKQGTRVKAIKLRGSISQGIVVQTKLMPKDHGNGNMLTTDTGEVWVNEGQEVSELLGITKYEPKIPTCLNGEVCNVFGNTLKFDIENIQKHPDIFEDGEQVLATEKLHGTWTCFGYVPMLGHPDLREGNLIITSKGLSDQGLAFKDNEANEKNLYVRTFDAQEGLMDALKALAVKKDQPVYVLGETFGMGVQDLHYGLTDTKFLAFDIYVGEPGKGEYLNCLDFMMTAHTLHIDTVPVLYRGPFIQKKLKEFRDGNETISGRGDCIREGIVIKPCTERRDDRIGRVVLKWVSPDYLTRRGKKGQELTEFN